MSVTRFSCLRQLKLNNVTWLDLLQIIQQVGHNITLLDLDNFSVDTTPQTWVDLAVLGHLCPQLQTLAVTMAHCCFTRDGSQKMTRLFANLENFSLKGVTFVNSDVLCDVLLQTCGLVNFTFFQKLEKPQVNREPSKEPLNDAKLANIVKKHILKSLRMFHVTAIDHVFGPVLIGESSVFLLVSSCPELEKIGNLSKWLIEDMDQTMTKLGSMFSWGRI